MQLIFTLQYRLWYKLDDKSHSRAVSRHIPRPCEYTRTKPMHGWRHDSWHENAFCITGPLWGESTDRQWILVIKAQWCRFLTFSFMWAWVNEWTNSQVAGDLIRPDAHLMLPWYYRKSRSRIHSTPVFVCRWQGQTAQVLVSHSAISTLLTHWPLGDFNLILGR